ncbi:two-component system sensor histidine kinase NtrB [Thermodesulforhabdus norvegica]|uniref:histidine kinase n=1 Tax=Thermodesulforhabdus norvegica TaxID=39841 RepID=A0A1I4QXX4_9BACT|nr:ATP-binding protein [Thermodesulforhabdus norvegica]SFM44861.1 two-component system, NtrC family, sensor histidine kinase HydH [Thermodesulforhabdus norvegica]
MTAKRGVGKNRFLELAPWAIVSSVVILVILLIAMAFRSLHRGRDMMEQALLSEALTLANSIEAMCNCGVIHNVHPHALMPLFGEISKLPGVLYVMIVKADGTIVAAGKPERVDRKIPFNPPGPGSKWVGLKERMGMRAYEVTLHYRPMAGDKTPPDDLYFVLGLDPLPYETAIKRDFQFFVFMLAVMLLVGAAGMVSLWWVGRYHESLRSLADVEYLMSTLIEQIPVGFVLVDNKGVVERINRAAEALIDAEQGKAFSNCPGFADLWRNLQYGDNGRLDQEITISGNRTRKLHLMVNALRFETDTRSGYVFLITDVTKMRELESKLSRTRHLAAIGHLVTGLAHEIRNPLSSIKGFATVLAKRTASDEKNRYIAEVMIKEIDRLNGILYELLDFARTPNLKLDEVECRSLIEHALRVISRDLEQSKVKVTMDIEPPDLYINVDPNKMIQVFINLFLNALQAIGREGTIRVQARRDDEEAVIAISDTGPGIPEEALDKIFDPYFTTKPQGVGLGLANVRKIVEAHGGTVVAMNSPEGGASFIIRLPFSPGYEET